MCVECKTRYIILCYYVVTLYNVCTGYKKSGLGFPQKWSELGLRCQKIQHMPDYYAFISRTDYILNQNPEKSILNMPCPITIQP